MTSTHPDSRSSDGADTSARLLAAAMAVIERDGEAAVRVRDVATAAGVTYSAVQFHFGGRDGLVDAAYLELYRRDLLLGLADLTERVTAAADAEEFRRLISGMLAAAFVDERAPARLRRAQVLGAAATRPAIAAGLVAIHREYLSTVAAVLEEPRRRGWLRAGADPAAMTAVYIAIVNGRAFVEIGDTGVDRAAWDAAASAAVLGFIESPGPTAPPR